MLILKILYIFKGYTKNIDFNDFIYFETLFDDINSKKEKDLKM